MTAAPERRLARAAIFVALGLGAQLAASLRWTPLTFVLSAAVGIPLTLLGGALFVRAVLGVMKDKGAL
jgi:hypothetical protein